MISEISTGFNKFIIISVALLGLGLADSRPACAGASNKGVPQKENQRPNAMAVAQNQTRASTPETDSSTSESREFESQSQEEQNSTAAQKKPLKDFKPTERIEADQAVDFPYDI